jgi:hypothetical protein
MPLWIEDGQKLFECEIDALAMSLKRDGVVVGCGVTASAVPDMNVNVAAGQIRSGDALVSIVAAALAVTAADATNPRKDIVVSSSAGALSVVVGTAAPVPKPPALPAGSILLAVVDVAAGDTAINSTEIHDRRLVIPQHKATHATGGSDALSPADIGAVNKAGDTMTGDLTLSGITRLLKQAANDGRIIIAGGSAANGTSGAYMQLFGANYSDAAYAGNIVLSLASGKDIYINGVTQKVWHAGNDGAGSGLDADLLDGLNSGAFAKEYQASIGGFSNAGWTTIAFIDGSGLNSKIRLTMGGTTNSVVVAVVADIIVNHHADIYVQSASGSYTQVTLRITSDANDNFYIQAMTNSANVVTLDCRIFTYGGETVTMYTNNPAVSGTIVLDHICYIHQLATSSSGGTTNGMRINTNPVWHDNSMANGLRIENRTTDPASPAVGQIWLRTDL